MNGTVGGGNIVEIIYQNKDKKKDEHPVSELVIGQIFTGDIYGKDEHGDSEDYLESEGPFIRVTVDGLHKNMAMDNVPVLDLSADCVVYVPNNGWVENFQVFEVAQLHIVE
jgi:hypothetical protein